MTLRDHEVDQSEEICPAVGQFLAKRYGARLYGYTSESELLFLVDGIMHKLTVQTVESETQKTVLEARQERVLKSIERFMGHFWEYPRHFTHSNYLTFLHEKILALIENEIDYNPISRNFTSRL